jgi:hypothetical protein
VKGQIGSARPSRPYIPVKLSGQSGVKVWWETNRLALGRRAVRREETVRQAHFRDTGGFFMRWNLLLLPALLLPLLASATEVRADMGLPFGPRPRAGWQRKWDRPNGPVPAPERSAQLVIRRDKQVAQSCLKIPRKLLFQGTAAVPGGAQLGSALAPLQMVLLGLGLSMALTLGGFWLAGCRAVPRPGFLLALAALVALGLTCSTLWADMAPRWMRPAVPWSQDKAQSRVLSALPANLVGSGKVVIEVVETGDDIELILNKDMAAELARKLVPQMAQEPVRQGGAAARE